MAIDDDSLRDIFAGIFDLKRRLQGIAVDVHAIKQRHELISLRRFEVGDADFVWPSLQPRR